MFTDRSGKTFRSFGAYRDGPVGPFKYPHNQAVHAGKPSDDGHVYVGGFTVRMNPDGDQRRDHRLQLSQQLRAVGHLVRRHLPERQRRSAGVPRGLGDGVRQLRLLVERRAADAGRPTGGPGQTVQVAEWRQDDPGIAPAGDVYGGGSPTGNVFYENGALGAGWEGTFFAAEPGRNEIFTYRPQRKGAGFDLDNRKIFVTSNVAQKYAGSDFIGGGGTARGAVETLFRPSDVAIGPDGALYISDWIDARVGGHSDLDDDHVRRDLPHRAEGLRLEDPGVRRDDDRGADHGAAVARGQRAGDRVRRAESARRRRGERRGGDAERSQPVHARTRASTFCISSAPRDGSAPARPSRRPIRR